MYLEEFFRYKNQLMQDILTNETLVDLISCGSVELADAAKLAYDQVWPCEYITETLEEGKTYVCFDVDIQRSINKTFYVPVIYVWIFTHRHILRLPEGGLRTDKIAHEITKILDGSKMYGMGDLRLYSAKRFVPLNDWAGKVLTFDAKEISKTHPTGKKAPPNRIFNDL